MPMIKRLLKWMKERALSFKRRSFEHSSVAKEEEEKKKKKMEQWTRWHSACLLIASLVGGEDLVVGDRSRLIIKMPQAASNDSCSAFDAPILASETKMGTVAQVGFPAVFSRDDLGKDISRWSEKQAMAVATIVWLSGSQSGSVYGLGRYAAMQSSPVLLADRHCMVLESKLPCMNSEEELMIRAAITLGTSES